MIMRIIIIVFLHVFMVFDFNFVYIRLNLLKIPKTYQWKKIKSTFKINIFIRDWG